MGMGGKRLAAAHHVHRSSEFSGMRPFARAVDGRGRDGYSRRADHMDAARIELHVLGRRAVQKSTDIQAIRHIGAASRAGIGLRLGRLDRRNISVGKHGHADVAHLGVENHRVRAALQPEIRQMVNHIMLQSVKVAVELVDQWQHIDKADWRQAAIVGHGLDLHQRGDVASVQNLVDHERQCIEL